MSLREGRKSRSNGRNTLEGKKGVYNILLLKWKVEVKIEIDR